VDVKLVRERLGFLAKSLTVRGKQIQGLGYEPGSINPPTFFPTGVEVNRYPDGNRGRLRQWGITGKLLVGLADNVAAQEVLDALMSDGDADIAALFEVNDTLGGLVEDLVVRAITDYGPHEVAGQTYLGANVALELWAL
jgi:hypothetical protein